MRRDSGKEARSSESRRAQRQGGAIRGTAIERSRRFAREPTHSRLLPHTQRRQSLRQNAAAAFQPNRRSVPLMPCRQRGRPRRKNQKKWTRKLSQSCPHFGEVEGNPRNPARRPMHPRVKAMKRGRPTRKGSRASLHAFTWQQWAQSRSSLPVSLRNTSSRFAGRCKVRKPGQAARWASRGAASST